MTPPFRFLVRFKDQSGRVCYGECDGPKDADKLVGTTVKVLEGESPWDPDMHATGQEATITQLLCPLPETPIIYGVGVNYRKHVEESKIPAPNFPMLFVKPSDSLAGPLEDIPIDRESKLLDYEGELCVIIGKSCKNLDKSDEDPLDFVLGYTVGNDVSARHWQNPQLSGGQHGYAKAFDKFAPIGPSIVSTLVIPDPSKLRLTTKVNGQLRQETGTDDLLFDIRTVVRHMSRGKTIRPGTVIMTGTPSGVGWFMEPSGLLKDGDIVEVEIDQIGTIKNRMVFDACATDSDTRLCAGVKVRQ